MKIAADDTVKSNGLTFRGKVTSPNAACVTGRKVTLYRTDGNVLGSTTTALEDHRLGSEGITLGQFLAKVKRRTDGTAGTI